MLRFATGHASSNEHLALAKPRCAFAAQRRATRHAGADGAFVQAALPFSPTSPMVLDTYGKTFT
jgi:hypothetical protein